jgi:hypothetical protein
MRVIRTLLPLLILTGTVRAADAPATAPALYTIHGTVKAQDGVYLLKVAILKTDGELHTEIASRPYIQMKDGQAAEIMIGSEGGRAGGGGGGGAAVHLAPFTGYKLTAIKATSSNQVIYVFTVVEKDVVTFASTGTMAPEAATQPAK